MGVHEVSLNTNGTLLTRDLALKIIEAGIDWIIISVDGITKSTYESIRKGADFEALMKNIINLKLLMSEIDNPPKLRIQICKQSENAHEIEDWKKFFGRIADKIRVGNLHDPQGKRGYNVDSPKSCGQLWQRLTIAWDGSIYPCPSDFLGKCKLGNIKYNSIGDVWHSSYLNMMRKILAKKGRKYGPTICQKCSSYC
jgi:radical SAM protein with 4Fe4S-binding SPASM domain